MRTYKLVTLYFSLLLLFLVASWLNLKPMYIMACALLGFVLISWVLARTSLTGIDVKRVMPYSVHENEDVTVKFIVKNRTFWQKAALVLIDDLPEELICDHLSETAPFSINGYSEASVSYTFRAQQFGKFDIKSVRIVSSDPVGLYEYSKTITTGHHQILVLPQPEPIGALGSFEQGMRGMNQVDAGRWKGFGSEPQSVREYVPGDDLRRIHWRSSARRGKLHVLELEAGFLNDIIIFIDSHPDNLAGLPPNTAFAEMVRNAAFIIKNALEIGSSIRIFGQTVPAEFTAAARKPHVWRHVQHALAELTASSEWKFSELLAHENSRVTPNSSVFLFTSTVDKGICEAISKWKTRGVQINSVLYDKSHFDPSLPTIPEWFKDELRLTGSQVTYALPRIVGIFA